MLLNFLLPLPPLSEQQRIVAKVEELLALVEDLEINKIDLKSYIQQTKAKVLDMAIRGELVPQNPDDEPASVLLERIKNEQTTTKPKSKKTTHNTHYDNDKWLMVNGQLSVINEEVPFEIPKNWAWCRLGEVCEISRGGSPRPIKDFLTDDENGVNWIKIGDAEQGGKYIFRTKEKIKSSGLKFSRYVEKDDFLLTNSMSFGRPYILKTNGCIHDGWLVIKLNKKLLSVDFAYYLLSSNFIYQQFSNLAVGSTVKNLKSESVQNTKILLPPLAEQRRIVEKIEQIFSILEELEENLI